MTPRLAPLPAEFPAAVAALHRIAEEVVAPARKPDNEISLRATPGGFGTPEFEWEGDGHQVRVEGAELVREVDGTAERTPLEVDAAASGALGELYALGALVLGRLVEEAGPDDAATIPRLWPEHFDIAIELGAKAAGRRADYGLSPGDEAHAEPYLYVGPWTAEVSGRSGTRAASTAPSSATPSCLRPRTRSPRRWTSCAPDEMLSPRPDPTRQPEETT